MCNLQLLELILSINWSICVDIIVSSFLSLFSMSNQTDLCPVFVCLVLHEQIIISRQKKTTNEIRFKYNQHIYLHELYGVKSTHSNVISI